MQAIYYYFREHRCWYGYWADEQFNQLSETVNACCKEDVLIELGACREEALLKLRKGVDRRGVN